MARSLLVGALCIASLAAVTAAPRPVEEKFDRLHGSRSPSGEAEITKERIKAHITWLASDENRGRNTAKGILESRVAEYLEAELKAAGFAPRGNKEGTSYRQPFYARAWMSKAKHMHEHDTKRAPKDWGVEPNQYGVAIGPDGKPASVDPLPPELSIEEPGASPNTFNLIGFLEGKDPIKKSEIVVIGAHMDHIGERSWGSGDKIYNGADDNGSGTTAMLTIARALAKDREAGNGPARSILLCLFSGEELGLLGSQFFATNPTVEFAKIKSMLNIDMIGRGIPGKVSVCDDTDTQGPNHFHWLHDTAGTGITSVNHDINGLMRRSDQYPFWKRGVPVIFFFEGWDTNGSMNPDYHGLGDHPDKIDIQKMHDIIRFAYRHILGAANL